MTAFRLSAAALLPLAFAAAVPVAQACDLCAVYSADQASGQVGLGGYAGIAEQFTRYDRLSEDGRRLRDDAGQYVNSSITQILVGYRITDRITVQASVPYINRHYRRPEGGINDVGTVSGLGDINLSGQFSVWDHTSSDGASSVSAQFLGGLKLPTGSSKRIEEELGPEAAPAEGQAESGIHGHDLTLGTGSVDFVVGTSVKGRYEEWIAKADVQYAIRTRGDYDYRFGNDLQWNVGAGRYLLLGHHETLSASVNVSGEYKKFDSVNGERPEDTQSRVLFVGPQLSGSLNAT